MKSFFTSTALIVFAIACNQKIETQYVLKVKVEPFDSTKIFDYEYVADYNFDLNETNVDSLQKISKKHFLKAIDLYKNNKNPEEAIDYFRKSIYLYPEPKTYFELASAMLDTKNLEQIELSKSIIYLLERLNYTPSSSLQYLKIVSEYYFFIYDNPEYEESLDRVKLMEELLANRKKYLIEDMIRGLKNGYYDLAKMKGDVRIKAILDDSYFKLKYNELLTTNEREGAKLQYSPFQEFVNLFPKNERVFSTSLGDPSLSTYTTSIDYSFSKYISEMENTSFGREVSNDFFYVANLKQTEKYTALLYKSVSFWGSDGAPVYTMLVTYDTDGKQISKIMFCCECSYSKVKIATYDNQTITIKDFERKWEKSLKDVPLEENKVTEIKLTSSYELEINDLGMIIDKRSNQTFTDSTLKASL